MTGAGPLPSRRELEARRTGYIVRGSWTKADLWTTVLPDGRDAVVKDFAAKNGLVRLWGRLQIAREVKFLRLLADLREVPRLFGRLDAVGLVMERLRGEPFYLRHPGPEWRGDLLALRAALDAIQARGVVHNDLRGRENVWLREGGGIVVIDWAGALRLRPGTLRHRLLFGPLSAIDDSAYLKWKEMLDPESLTDADREQKRRFRRWRRLWPFNRKGVGWTRS